MKILTKQEVLSLRKELNKVLEKFNETSDIKMEIQDAKYSVDVTFQLVGTKLDSTGNPVTKKSVHFGIYSYKHGLKESALNYEFKHHGKSIKVLGYNTKAKKYSIEYNENGKLYRCTPSFMQEIIKESAPELLFT